MTSYTCSTCGREFSRRSSLRNHVKTHDDEVDRVLREISEELNHEENVHEQPVELNNDELIETELNDSKQQREEEKLSDIEQVLEGVEEEDGEEKEIVEEEETVEEEEVEEVEIEEEEVEEVEVEEVEEVDGVVDEEVRREIINQHVQFSIFILC